MMDNWSWSLGVFGTPLQLLMVVPLVSAILICMLTINQRQNPHDNHWSEWRQWSAQLKSVALCVFSFFCGVVWLSLG